MRKRENISAVETKNGEGKGGIYLEKENIMSPEETKNGKGKYLKKESHW